MTNQHIVPRNGKWAVQGAGNSKAHSLHSTQESAIRTAKGISQNQKSEMLIHGRDGKIRERNSYGNDSCPPRG